MTKILKFPGRNSEDSGNPDGTENSAEVKGEKGNVSNNLDWTAHPSWYYAAYDELELRGTLIMT